MSVALANSMPISKEDLEIKRKENASTKTQIRCMIANIYDLQKLRISAGNRIVQSFYLACGVPSGTSPDDVSDEKTAGVIDKAKKEYKLITDAVVQNGWTTARAIKDIKENPEKYRKENKAIRKGSSTLPTDTTSLEQDAKKGTKTQRVNEDELIEWIKDDNMYGLMSSYMKLLESEEGLTKVLEKEVKKHPLWNRFFAGVQGCGTLMAAVCIAYLDPYKAKYPSSFYKYCGLDTVQDEDKDGNKLYLKKVNGTVLPQKVREKVYYITADGEPYYGKAKATTDFDAEGNQIYKGVEGETLRMEYATKVVDGVTVPVFEDIESGEEYVGDVVVSQHGRRKGDTEMVEYTDADGNVQLKRSITYNPIVKTKLMGVLTGCMLKAGGKIVTDENGKVIEDKRSEYRRIYDDYRARLDMSSKHKDYTTAHKSMMAQHYMIKQFLRRLYEEWRAEEGLVVYPPYEEAVLKNKPHKCSPTYQACEPAYQILHK